jgi:hypothetical protein
MVYGSIDGLQSIDYLINCFDIVFVPTLHKALGVSCVLCSTRFSTASHYEHLFPEDRGVSPATSSLKHCVTEVAKFAVWDVA